MIFLNKCICLFDKSKKAVIEFYSEHGLLGGFLIMDDNKYLTFDCKEKSMSSSETVSLDELEVMTGFPKDHIAKELLIDNHLVVDDIPTNKLRKIMLNYLNSFV